MPKVAGNTNYKGTFSNYPHSVKGFSSNLGSKTSRGGGGQIRGVASGGYRSLRPASQMLLGTPEFINPTGVHHKTNEESPPKERDRVPEGYELHRISFSPPPHSKGPPSLSEDSSESSMFKQARPLKQPLLYVDVNLGLSRNPATPLAAGASSHRIVVCEGDTADSLSAAFCQKHGLDPQTQQRLAELLHIQIDNVLEKINEREGEEDESLIK